MKRFALRCCLQHVDHARGGGCRGAESFDEFYTGVSECRFDLSRYADLPMDPYAEAVLISLPAAGAVRGFLITTFYFSPGRDGKGEGYGLVFNARSRLSPMLSRSLPARETVNGHLRRLLRLSDETNDQGASHGKTLLICNFRHRLLSATICEIFVKSVESLTADGTAPPSCGSH